MHAASISEMDLHLFSSRPPGSSYLRPLVTGPHKAGRVRAQPPHPSPHISTYSKINTVVITITTKIQIVGVPGSDTLRYAARQGSVTGINCTYGAKASLRANKS